MRSLVNGTLMTRTMHLLKNSFKLSISNKINRECVCISRVVIAGTDRIVHTLTRLKKMDKLSLMTREMITNARSVWRWS